MIARLTLLAALVLAGVSLWVASAPLVGRVFGQSTALASSPGPQAVAPQPDRVDLTPVLDFAPFGRAEGVAEVAVPDGDDSGLVLLGITMTQVPGQSRAIIAGGDGVTQNFGLGDTIRPGVTLTGVFGDHVTLSRGGQERVLGFQPGDAGVPAVPTEFAAPQVADDTLISRLRAEIQQDAPGLLARLGLEVAEGGYLVTDAVSGDILQAGLQTGDLISAVNGQPLGDPGSDIARFDLVAAVGTANLSVLRNGATLLMTFPLK